MSTMEVLQKLLKNKLSLNKPKVCIFFPKQITLDMQTFKAIIVNNTLIKKNDKT